jgi:hypothetical protein
MSANSMKSEAKSEFPADLEPQRAFSVEVDGSIRRNYHSHNIVLSSFDRIPAPESLLQSLTQ